MEDVPITMRAKRKRGRPRKDSNLCSASTLPSPEYSTLVRNHASNQSIYPTPPAPPPPPAADPDKNTTTIADDAMVGSAVYGVVEGSFDAGYLISIRIGNNLTPFRGLVFQPRNVVALTPSNDVAPLAKMHQRREIQIPIQIPNPLPPQAPTNPDEGKTAYNVAGNLRMVEEDEVMQAFEVSTSPGGGSKSNLPNNGDSAANHEAPPPPPPNLQMCHSGGVELPQVRQTNLFQDVNFQENMFSNHQESPNLKLDLGFAAQKEKQMAEVYNSVLSGMKNPSIGFHQALVAGNPLLLPPDLIGEPLEFMMEKPKTPPSPQTEAQSRMVGSGEGFGGGEAMNSAASPAGVNTRIGDMDFMIMQQTHTNN